MSSMTSRTGLVSPSRPNSLSAPSKIRVWSHSVWLVGVISERELDVIGALPGSKQLSVEDAMVPDVYVTSQDTELATVVSDMARLKVGSAIVVQGDDVVGVFTAVDGLRALAELLRPPAEARPAAPA